MPKTVAQLFTEFATRLGVAADNPDLISLQSNAELTRINVPDALVAGINNGFNNYLTIDSAKNNSELMKHFKSLALNGLDKKLKDTLTAMEVDEDILRELDAESNSYEKVAKALAKIKELEAKKAGAKAPEKNELNKQIEELNRQIAAEKKSSQDKIQQLESSFQNERLDWNLQSLLGGYKYAAKELPLEANVVTAKHFLNKAITEKGLKIVFENGKPVLKKSDDTDYYENNEKVSLNGFAEGVLNSNKLLLSHDPDKGAPAGGGGTPTGGEPNKQNASFLAALDAEIGSLKQS